MAAMLGVASGRVICSFKIQVAKATNGQKNGSVEESKIDLEAILFRILKITMAQF